MGKRNKKTKNNKTESKKDDDTVDYIFDNMGAISNSFSDISRHARDVWDVIPDVLYNVCNTVISICSKIIYRLRSSLVVQITEDIKHHDIDKDLWDYLLSLSRVKNGDKSELSIKMKNIKKKIKSERGREFCTLLKYYVKKRRQEEFLSFCITQQNNPEFISIRDNIMTNMKSTNNTENSSHNSKLEKLVNNINDNKTKKFRRLE